MSVYICIYIYIWIYIYINTHVCIYDICIQCLCFSNVWMIEIIHTQMIQWSWDFNKMLKTIRFRAIYYGLKNCVHIYVNTDLRVDWYEHVYWIWTIISWYDIWYNHHISNYHMIEWFNVLNPLGLYIYIPATSKRQFFGRFCQTVKIFDDLRKNWRFRQKLPIGPSSLACPNKSIYLFYALSKDQMQSWKASIATNASPPIASVLDRTAPSANKCFSFSFSLAEYLFVSNARRLNRGHMCLC